VLRMKIDAATGVLTETVKVALHSKLLSIAIV
jgi:hypothetical protein